MERIIVTVNYLDFEFEVLEEAIGFARAANKAYKADFNERRPEVKLKVYFENEEENEDEV